MTTQTEIEAEEVLASKRNGIALTVMSGIAELLGSYDPENVLVSGLIADMVWEVEELLIDASYDIEDLVAEVGFGQGADVGATEVLTVPADPEVLTDGQGWILPGDEEDVKDGTPVDDVDFSDDFDGTTSPDSDESIEDPGFVVGA